MEVRGTLAPPTVTSVVVASAPQSGDTYRSYETIVFTVTFSEPVRVTPGRLRLKVGLDNPGGASGSTVEAVFSGLSQSQRPTADTPQARLAPHLHFEYKVQLFDRDVDGVRIGANALRLASGARIRSEGGGDAELDHAALGPQSDHKVDGTADVPMIERIEVVSTPRLRSKGTTTRDTYGEGENIRIEVRFDQPVVVEGEPTFALEVGNPCLAVCEAYYESGSGTNTLVFAYLVLEVDIDRNGIAIRGNPIEVVSGDSIRNAADQEAHLSSKGKGTQRRHKVDGSRAAGSHLSVEDAEAHEADGEMEFTVRLEPHGLGIVTVDYATADGTGSKAARAGSDYTETSGTLTFNSLETERTVSVPIMDDAHEDDGETFTLTLSNPDGAKLRSGDGEATGTIRNSEIQPLTATFEDVPSAHDGSAFTFRMAFSEDIGISYRALREDALAVTGGRVTRGARVDDRRDLFEMTVRPESDDDVTITLQAGRECAVSGAICTKGENRRQLTNTPAATVAGPAVESGAAGLTAAFVGMSSEHRGEGGFRFRVAFSEDIGISFRSLREDTFTVTGGRVTGGKRVDGRRVSLHPGQVSTSGVRWTTARQHRARGGRSAAIPPAQDANHGESSHRHALPAVQHRRGVGSCTRGRESLPVREEVQGAKLRAVPLRRGVPQAWTRARRGSGRGQGLSERRCSGPPADAHRLPAWRNRIASLGGRGLGGRRATAARRKDGAAAGRIVTSCGAGAVGDSSACGQPMGDRRPKARDAPCEPQCFVARSTRSCRPRGRASS